MAIVGFDEVIVIRLRSDEKKKIIQIYKKNKDVYESVSHFVRSSVIRNLRRYDKKGREVKDDAI